MTRPILCAFTICAALATPAKAEVDACMVGFWEADIADIADMLALQMNGIATPTGGHVRMIVTNGGGFNITVNDMTIKVQVPDIPEMDVKVEGYSAGSFDATDGVWMAGVTDYNLTGSADVLGETMTLPFTSSTGMFGGGTGSFSCSGDTLRLDGDPSVPMRFIRNWKRE